MKTLLLIGGSGFIGANLAETLLDMNMFNIIVLDIANANFNNLNLIKENITILKGNIEDKSILYDIFKNYSVDKIIKLVTTLLHSSNVESSNEKINNNINSNINLLNLMERYSIKNIVFFSSGGTVYGDDGKFKNNELDKTVPINLYGWLKLTLENLIDFKVNSNLGDGIRKYINSFLGLD